MIALECNPAQLVKDPDFKGPFARNLTDQKPLILYPHLPAVAACQIVVFLEYHFKSLIYL